jgi:hypothetical protein
MKIVLMLERGQIVRFFYLCKRQADAGEETGRKARPACTQPIGSVSPAFLASIAATVKEAARMRRLSGVVRS